MKRLTLVVALAAFAATILASSASTAPAVGPTTLAAPAAEVATLPPLPAAVRNRKRWLIGVKCDAPPFGYIDVRGKHAGYDVEIAKWFGRFAFGNASRVSYTCAPTPAREPLINTNRVDLVIATFTYTGDRDTRIDFSRAYYKATGRLLVRNNGPINRLGDIAGRSVSTTSGSIYDRWMKRCFTSTNVIVTDNLTNALLEFRNGRADAVMWDDTVLVSQAAQDRSLKLTPDLFLALPYGIGMKQGNIAMKRWVDSRLNIMKKRDLFFTILKNNIPPRDVAAFSKNILRPKQNFAYNPPGVAPETTCP
ncbi:MAG: transporter substrate-binding domain-containing protein [Gaiellaceae bacterium]